MSSSSTVYPRTATENLAVMSIKDLFPYTRVLTPRDLFGKLNSLGDRVGSGLNGALDGGVGIDPTVSGMRIVSRINSRFLAHIESLLKQLDQTEFNDNICGRAILRRQSSSRDIDWLTSMTCVTSASTVTVRFFPGTGGSGDTVIFFNWLSSAGIS